MEWGTSVGERGRAGVKLMLCVNRELGGSGRKSVYITELPLQHIHLAGRYSFVNYEKCSLEGSF